MSTFGESLKRIRKERGISQSQLANGIGVSIKTVRRYEHNETNADAEMIRRMAEFLNVTADELLDADAYQNRSIWEDFKRFSFGTYPIMQFKTKLKR